MTGKTYQVILADPPWAYRNQKTGGSMKSGAVAKYPTMGVDEICALQVPADKDSVLFLWATVPFLPEALEVMKCWNFHFKTMITWDKSRLGLGYWWRGQCEHLLFGVRGKVPAFRMQEPNIIRVRPGRHSQKPEAFREMIERATVGMDRKLEMFARTHPGGSWEVWGNEVDSNVEIGNVNL